MKYTAIVFAASTASTAVSANYDAICTDAQNEDAVKVFEAFREDNADAIATCAAYNAPWLSDLPEHCLPATPTAAEVDMLCSCDTALLDAFRALDLPSCTFALEGSATYVHGDVLSQLENTCPATTTSAGESPDESPDADAYDTPDSTDTGNEVTDNAYGDGTDTAGETKKTGAHCTYRLRH